MDEKIIGRDREFELLSKYMKSCKNEFVALYGRRRVGKTFLVRNFFNDKFDFYVSGVIDGTKEEQFAAFNNALAAYGYRGKPLSNWIDAFAALGGLLKRKMKGKKRRCVVFIDELPCFDTRNSRFVKAFGYFWNSQASWLDNVFLIVCGSATSWMIKNIVDNRGGLHNRITHQIHLKPFDLNQTELYFKIHRAKWDRLSILQIYMALGGIPYYLSLLDFSESAAANIDRLFFADNAELHKEYKRLFQSLYSNPDHYIEIINQLSKSKKGLTRKEIAKNVGTADNGHLGETLDNLVNCDFVRTYYNGTKRNQCIYQLMDFYLLFYHQFCLRGTTDTRFWQNGIGTPQQNTWYGLAFERVCMWHVHQLLQALHLDTIHTEYYSWRSSVSDPKTQIDIAIDRSDGIVTLCEAKYSKTAFTLTKAEYERILYREEAFKTETKCRKGVQNILVTTNSVNRNTYSDIFLKIITLDDIFEPLE